MRCFLKKSIIVTFFSISILLQPSEHETVRRPIPQRVQFDNTPQVVSAKDNSSIPAGHFPTANNESTVIKIIDIVEFVKNNALVHGQIQQHNQNQQELFNHLRSFNQNTLINAEIKKAQDAFIKAADVAAQLFANMKAQGKAITTADVFNALQPKYQTPGNIIETKNPEDLFTSTVFPACYQPIVEQDLSGWTQKKLQIKSLTAKNAAEQETLKHQIIGLLQKLATLWDIVRILFANGQQDINITLHYPQGSMSTKDWAKLTQDAEKQLQSTTEIGKEKQAKIAQQMKALEDEEIKKRTEITKLEETETAVIAILAAQDKDRKKLIEEKTKREKAFKINLLPQNLQTAQKLIDSFETCKKYHDYKHLLFTKNDIPTHIQTALDTLKNLLELLTTINSTTTTAPTAQETEKTTPTKQENAKSIEQKIKFIQQMNTLYSFLFIKEFAPGSIVSRTPNFLCFKHHFKAFAADLPERDAIPAVTSLVILWEIYKNLPTDSGTESVILPYFNKTQTVDEWINDTRNCGFKEYGTFSLPLAPGRPSHLDTALSACLPAKEPSFFDQSLESAANTLKSVRSWFSSTWTRLTSKSHSIVDEPVDL